MPGDILKESDFTDVATVATAPTETAKIKPIITFHRRPSYERVVAPAHPLYDCVVEISGVGRGGRVFAIFDGVEHEFHSDQLCEIAKTK